MRQRRSCGIKPYPLGSIYQEMLQLGYSNLQIFFLLKQKFAHALHNRRCCMQEIFWFFDFKPYIGNQIWSAQNNPSIMCAAGLLPTCMAIVFLSTSIAFCLGFLESSSLLMAGISSPSNALTQTSLLSQIDLIS